MNKTITLVNAWGEFEQKYPDSSLQDFCRHYLEDNKADKQTKKKDILTPDNTSSILMRTMGRIMLVHSIIADKALADTGVGRLEEFTMLNTVFLLNHPKKSEAIQACLHEISTGTDILNRLKKQGYLTEQNDKEDKRSKRVMVTVKGEKALTKAKQKIITLAKLVLSGMAEDDKKICIHLLQDVETKLKPLVSISKNKTFDELLKEIIKL